MRIYPTAGDKHKVTDGKKQALDPTSIETRFISDPDAEWSYDETKGEYYFGYSLIVNWCTETHLPLAAVFTQSKKVSYEETKPVLQNTPIMPEKFFADAITVHKTRPGISVRRTITVL